MAGIDAIKFVRWLLEDFNSFLPPLTRKIQPILDVDVASIQQIPKVSVQKRFTSRQKRAWTDQEIQNFKNYVLQNPNDTDKIIGNYFNRTARSIQHQRKNLGLQKAKNIRQAPNVPYKPEEVSLIQTFLNSNRDRSSAILVELVKQINALPCNKGQVVKTVRSVRNFIRKSIDKKDSS